MNRVSAMCAAARGSLRQSDLPRVRFKYQVYQTDLHGDVKEGKKKKKKNTKRHGIFAFCCACN
jgi:ribosomal protein S12